MNKTVLGTIIGTALLGLAKAKRGGRNGYRPIKIEDIYDLSAEQKAQITLLNLKSKVLRELPDDIFDGFTNLEKLDLNDNELTKLPQSIGNLTKLKGIYLGYNQLTELPDSIGNLTNLEKLWLHNNQLTELPDSIDNLTNLKTLLLPGNQLTELPESIDNLTNLEDLNLESNQLTELPNSIGNLTNLDTLWLDGNNWKKPVSKETILKMIRNRVQKSAIKSIINMNNSIPIKSKSNLRIR